MSALENLTPFAAACIPSMSRNDEQLTLLIVAGCFVLPRPGVPSNDAPAIADEQPPVRLADEHTGDPAGSSLLHEGQSAYLRHGTDIYLNGTAWAPMGRPAPQSMVALQVGAWQKAAVVFGERVWGQGITGASPTAPLPFTSLPLIYERCFGGSPSDPSRALAELAQQNPVGRGLFAGEREAIGQPLPNFEDPLAPLQSLRDRPRPCGFGPVARHWQPRRSFAGTYDQAWVEQRIPFWPRDFDERFFCAAAPGLHAAPHLQGGEAVRIVGMAPDGAHEFVLPSLRLRARFEVPGATLRKQLVLDAVSLEPDSGTFTLIWRTQIVADPLRVSAAVVRLLEPWEAA